MHPLAYTGQFKPFRDPFDYFVRGTENKNSLRSIPPNRINHLPGMTVLGEQSAFDRAYPGFFPFGRFTGYHLVRFDKQSVIYDKLYFPLTCDPRSPVALSRAAGPDKTDRFQSADLPTVCMYISYQKPEAAAIKTSLKSPHKWEKESH
jgi:hypothetical protein